MDISKLEQVLHRWSPSKCQVTCFFSSFASLCCHCCLRCFLQAWWSRMSNRFRNLKLGGTFRVQPTPVLQSPTEFEDKKPMDSLKPGKEVCTLNLNMQLVYVPVAVCVPAERSLQHFYLRPTTENLLD